jgi:predicted Zn-dependent protease
MMRDPRSDSKECPVLSSLRPHCAFCTGLSRLVAGSATEASTDLPAAAPLRRRRFGGALLAAGATVALPAWAREGVDVGPRSSFSKLVSAEQIEEAAGQQYAQMMSQARSKRALAPDDHPQVVRLRAIAQRIVPFTDEWNERAKQWRWEVNLLGSSQINAFCMPGGKIAFYSAILSQLKLEDDEVAAIMGHEVAHALREHARERIGKGSATSIGLSIGAQLLGLGQLGDMAANLGTQLLTMKFGREDETEADLVGIELAARAGYEPQAAVRLWNKMGAASKGAPPQWLSTHPSNSTRIGDIKDSLPKVAPLYARADKPSQRFPPMEERDAAKPRTPSREQSR